MYDNNMCVCPRVIGGVYCRWLGPCLTTDSIWRDPQRPHQLQFHYIIVQVLATVPSTSPRPPVFASDDAEAAMWFNLTDLPNDNEMAPDMRMTVTRLRSLVPLYSA